MNETVTATFDSETKIKNVVRELTDSVGIPQEKILVDKASKQVKVIIPATAKSEVKRVMEAEHPESMSERVWDS